MFNYVKSLLPIAVPTPKVGHIVIKKSDNTTERGHIVRYYSSAYRNINVINIFGKQYYINIYEEKKNWKLTFSAEYHDTILLHLKIKCLIQPDGLAVEVDPAFFVAEKFHVLALQNLKTL